jgi:glycosyltransferase involved in cell wall biosynthesis
VVGQLTVVSGDFVLTGGMDRANYALADYAARTGVDVDLVSHRVSPELAAHAKVRWHRVPRPGGWHAVGEPLLDRRGRAVIAERRTRGGVGVVNGGNCLAAAVNWVHYVHAVYQEPLEAHPRSVKHWLFGKNSARRERVALQKSPLVITNSDTTRRAVEALGVDPARARTVYYGIDPELFYPASEGERAEQKAALGLTERPAVAFVGALGDRRKGFDTLFAAWERLAAEPSWDADLVVIGTGRDLEIWRARAADKRLDRRIHFLGFRRDVPAVLAACDALVAPTRYEAFGLGVAEALARGLPAVVSAGAGVAELYPPALQTLLFEDVESVSELVGRLRDWRARKDELGPHVAELSERVRARTWDTMASDILKLASEL